jgi:6-pyruvoyltetrahydropterin/6-carboxytetrahydropterin synthase
MYSITKTISFCYGHRLMHHNGKCRHLHGHNARVVVRLEGAALNEQGMLMDFVEIKRSVKDWIDRELDHTLLLHRDDPVLPLLQHANERVRVMSEHPTAENIAKLIFEFAVQSGLPVTEVSLWETDTACASYRPEHA